MYVCVCVGQYDDGMDERKEGRKLEKKEKKRKKGKEERKN